MLRFRIAQKKSEFDGNWDPDRNIERPATLPAVNDLDLAAGPTGVNTSPHPFSLDDHGPEGSGPYSPTTTSYYSGNPLLASGATTTGLYHDGQYPQQQQMSQYTRSGGEPSILSSASMYPPSSEAHGASSSAGGAGGMAAGRAMRVNKQQEAAQAYAETHPKFSGMPRVPAAPPMSDAVQLEEPGERQGLNVVNPDEQNDLMSGGSSVVQHRDGGRVRIPEAVMHENDAEIPPSYDSIPPDDVDNGPAATARTR